MAGCCAMGSWGRRCRVQKNGRQHCGTPKEVYDRKLQIQNLKYCVFLCNMIHLTHKAGKLPCSCGCFFTLVILKHIHIKLMFYCVPNYCICILFLFFFTDCKNNCLTLSTYNSFFLNYIVWVYRYGS